MKHFGILMLMFISATVFSETIKINQVGYNANQSKVAIVPSSSATSFSVIDAASGLSVYQGTLSASAHWEFSGEDVSQADFSAFAEPGRYFIATEQDTSYVFQIFKEGAYSQLSKWALKGFYFWRASTAIDAKYAQFKDENYARNAGHPDTEALIHSSAVSEGRPENTVISSPKGWYDAGDYNKYIVNGASAVYSMLHAYTLMPEYFAKNQADIPESGNAIPDILDEVKWELDWFLTMQDPADGGVYHKLTTKNFTGEMMPEFMADQRYIVGKSTAAALDFAATMAKASCVYRSIMPEFADVCLIAAEKAYAWAKANPKKYFTNPSDVVTGEYGDDKLDDEFYWAQVELAIATNKSEYLETLARFKKYTVPTWSDVETFGLLSVLAAPDSVNIPATIKGAHLLALKTAADSIGDLIDKSAYKTGIESFFWGSNGFAANIGLVSYCAYKHLDESGYLDDSYQMLDYVLGRNATGYCFVTGFGSLSPQKIHDRRSQSDGIRNPIPGYLAGGPNKDALNDCQASSYPSSEPAKSYLDSWCSYSTNEIAINWNCGLVFLSSALDSESKNHDSFVYSAELTADSVITLAFAEGVTGDLLAGSCYLLQGADTLQAVSVSKVTDNPLVFAIALESAVLQNPTQLQFIADTSNLQMNGVALNDFSAPVKNRLPWSAPAIVKAETNGEGNQVVVSFGTKINLAQKQGFHVFYKGIDYADSAVAGPDTNTVTIYTQSLAFDWNLLVTADSAAVASAAAPVVAGKLTAEVVNYTIPPNVSWFPSYKELYMSGQAIVLVFDAEVSIKDSVDVAVFYNTTDTFTIEAVEKYDEALVVFIDRRVVPEDELRVEYSSGLVNADGAALDPFTITISNIYRDKPVPVLYRDSLTNIYNYNYAYGYYNPINDTVTEFVSSHKFSVVDAGEYTLEFDVTAHGAIYAENEAGEELFSIDVSGKSVQEFTFSLDAGEQFIDFHYPLDLNATYFRIRGANYNPSGTPTGNPTNNPSSNPTAVDEQQALSVYPTVLSAGELLHIGAEPGEAVLVQLVSQDGSVVFTEETSEGVILIPAGLRGCFLLSVSNGPTVSIEQIMVQ